ncbi:hypothetical protein FRB90_008304 [Tulasnella sp. 427]|nr:hypothetical protein FRB90_008304 [Tulasnella sp. 427]
MNPDTDDRSTIEMDEQDLHDSPSDNPASPAADGHGPSAASSSTAVPGGPTDKKAVIRGARLSEATKARRAAKAAAAVGGTAGGGTSEPGSAGSSSRQLNPLPKLEEGSEFMELDENGLPPPPAPNAPPNSGRPRSFSTKEIPGPASYHNSTGSGPPSAGPHAISPTAPPGSNPHIFPGSYAPPYMPSGPSGVDSTQSPTRREHLSRKGSTSGDDEDGRSDENLFPGSMVQKEKNKFLSMVLNPADPNHPGPNPGFLASAEDRRAWEIWTQHSVWEPPPMPGELPPCFETVRVALPDPLDLGLLSPADAEMLLAKVFQHLNPFVNLFDEQLHTVHYIRERSSFLFTVLMAAGSKFWKPLIFRRLQKMAYVFASRALIEQWKGLEIVQAFACMVYWKEPEDNRNWTYIGHDELVRNSMKWHLAGHRGQTHKRPEDVIVAAFVQLRRLSVSLISTAMWALAVHPPLLVASLNPPLTLFGDPCFLFLGGRCKAETSDVFYLRRNAFRDNSDVNYEVLLMGCNRKLTDWIEHWESEMKEAGGGEFHEYLLRFFRLHVRLFLNSLGLTASSNHLGSQFSLQSLTLCYTSAKETLQIVQNFKNLEVLMYAQEVITVMSAYAAIFLLKLLRRGRPETVAALNVDEVHSLIKEAAKAFATAGANAGTSTSSAAHGRFMDSLVENKQLQVHASEAQLGSEFIPHEGHVFMRQPVPLAPPPQVLHMYRQQHLQQLEQQQLQQRQQQQQQQQQQPGMGSPASAMASQQLGQYAPGPAATPPAPGEGMGMQPHVMIGPPTQQQHMTTQVMDGSGGGGPVYYGPQQQPPPQQRRPTISQAASSFASDSNATVTPPGGPHAVPPGPHHPAHIRMNSTSNGYGPQAPNANPGGSANGTPTTVNMPSAPPPPYMAHQQQQQGQAYGGQQGMGMPFGGDQQQQVQPQHPQVQYQAEAMMMPLGQGHMESMYTRHIFDQLGMPDMFPAGYADQFGGVGEQNIYR